MRIGPLGKSLLAAGVTAPERKKGGAKDKRKIFNERLFILFVSGIKIDLHCAPGVVSEPQAGYFYSSPCDDNPIPSSICSAHWEAYSESRGRKESPNVV